MSDEQKPLTTGQKLQSLPKPVLYLVLIVAIVVTLYKPFNVPNVPQDHSIDLYANLMSISPGQTILVGSDWTKSTQAESKGSAMALLKILMRKGIKFAYYSTGDPQAPAVLKDTIKEVSDELVKANEIPKPYEIWEDFVTFGYYPNSDSQNQSIGQNVRKAFDGRRVSVKGEERDVWQSPVLKGKSSLKDFACLLLISPSSTDKITVRNLSGKIQLNFAVTGVMLPENQNYHASGQLAGLIGGLKGVYDLETLMEEGINQKGGAVKSSKYDKVPSFKGLRNKGNGYKYYPTLHVAICIMFLAVIVGNIGMFMVKRGK